MQGFQNDKNGFINEYLISYWALAHPVFKITFQSGCLRDFLSTVEMSSCGLFLVFLFSIFLKMVRLLVVKEC